MIKESLKQTSKCPFKHQEQGQSWEQLPSMDRNIKGKNPRKWTVSNIGRNIGWCLETYQRKHRGQARRCKLLLCLASSVSPSIQWGAVAYVGYFFLIICWLFKKLVKRSFVVLTGLGKHYICPIESKWWSLYQSKKTNISHFFVFSVFSCKTLMEPASCCPRNKSSGQCSTLCLCRSWLTHEESEKSILSQKIQASVFWTLEDSGKGIFWRGIDFPGPWKVRILRSCVVELRVLQNPPATEFYFWLLKGGYFRVDQHGLAYLQISCCLDYKLVDTF